MGGFYDNQLHLNPNKIGTSFPLFYRESETNAKKAKRERYPTSSDFVSVTGIFSGRYARMHTYTETEIGRFFIVLYVKNCAKIRYLRTFPTSLHP